MRFRVGTDLYGGKKVTSIKSHSFKKNATIKYKIFHLRVIIFMQPSDQYLAKILADIHLDPLR